MDHLLNYMKKNNIPITRENYINANWMGDRDPDQQLPPELETELPEQIQEKGSTNEPESEDE